MQIPFFYIHMKNTLYFQHDQDASTDEKILDLRCEFGWEGYGIYWALIEWMHRESGRLEYKLKRISSHLNCKPEIIKAMVDEFELFVIEEHEVDEVERLFICSPRLIAQIQHREEISEKRRNAGLKKANGQQLQNKMSANAPKRKEKKRKEKERKEDMVRPSVEEVMDYFETNGYDPEKGRNAFRYYAELNWRDAKGNEVRSWKAKMNAVWFKEENKLTAKTNRINIIDQARHDFNS